ncbi:hypothetical protein [Pontibacter ruber]|uniref:Competence protein CoiA-like protein n=1 Tax=Pontibacter ruber TaxID=1343895 RepID=A0ABW5CXQ8_9BACT|nr:hypothetical protein [Pontibacter ruber]
MIKIKEVAFEYAKYNTGEVLHITSAQSGANGYYCIGCNSQMIAYFGKRQPHFKHHPNDVEKSQECTWSDETYRHKIAKEILQRLKEVRVPKVSIAVPKEHGGGSVTIAPASTVRASKVLIERYIYEDEHGQIKIGKEFDDMGGRRHLLVKPDVLFLNEQNKPILIIELCATHKTDEEKRMKLMHLGIDSIELLIPKAANPQEIEKNIISLNNSKWLYSNEQAKTKFNPAAHLANKPGIVIDREPGDIPKGETLQCRLFRIKECIRGIKKFMGSGDYAEGRRAVEDGLSRAKGNAERAGEELADRDRRARATAKGAILQLVDIERAKAKALEPEEECIRREEDKERGLDKEQERDYKSLEERYYEKRDRLIREQSEVRAGESYPDGEMGSRRTELIARVTELREYQSRLERIKRERIKLGTEEAGISRYKGQLRDEERRIELEEKQANDASERAAKQREAFSKECEQQTANITRVEQDIREMEEKQRRARECREKLARIKDRAIDARFNRRG